jgi:hypothetical protein
MSLQHVMTFFMHVTPVQPKDVDEMVIQSNLFRARPHWERFVQSNLFRVSYLGLVHTGAGARSYISPLQDIQSTPGRPSSRDDGRITLSQTTWPIRPSPETSFLPHSTKFAQPPSPEPPQLIIKAFCSNLAKFWCVVWRGTYPVPGLRIANCSSGLSEQLPGHVPSLLTRIHYRCDL